MRAKIEAVHRHHCAVCAPFVAALALALALACAGRRHRRSRSPLHRRPPIQLWFRAQARRSHFRRRQTSSRLATFAEAFSSIAWAATAALAAAGTWLAAITGLIAAGILIGTRLLSPRKG